MISPRIVVVLVVLVLFVVEFVVVDVPPPIGGGGTLPPGPSAKAAGEANKASVPERTSSRKEFLIGRGILLSAKRAQS
jgi:hypothetical protein